MPTVQVYNPTPAKAKRPKAKAKAKTKNKKEENDMAQKAKKSSAPKKPQQGQNTPRKPGRKKNPATAKTAVKKPAKSRGRFKNGPAGNQFSAKRFGIILLSGLVGYAGTNVTGKVVADMVPSAYATWKPHIRIITKAAVTGLAVWQGPKVLPTDVAIGVAIGAGLATGEDMIKTYASGFAPAIVNGLDEAGAFNNPAVLEIQGEVVDDQKYLLPGDQNYPVNGAPDEEFD